MINIDYLNYPYSIKDNERLFGRSQYKLASNYMNDSVPASFGIKSSSTIGIRSFVYYNTL